MLDATTVFMMSAKPVSHIPQSPRLLDQLREVLRCKHYSLRTEEAYLYWVNVSFAGVDAARQNGRVMLWPMLCRPRLNPANTIVLVHVGVPAIARTMGAHMITTIMNTAA